jgi:hypothetical protein
MMFLATVLCIGAPTGVLAEGAARKPLYADTADFLQHCGGPAPSAFPCMAAFGLVESVAKGICHPPTASSDPLDGQARYTALIVRVTDWLKWHPQYSQKPYGEGVNAGLRALYPCK